VMGRSGYSANAGCAVRQSNRAARLAERFMTVPGTLRAALLCGGRAGNPFGFIRWLFDKN
ncbi:hypothetical protein, partial [Achromobacter dolens]|uniref:hypothetical protein n=1 Tax=Achromobacter dolens TaxID=1287738 RepID=UPI0031D1967D